MEFRWLRLAEQAHERGAALGHESGLTTTLFPLHDKPAAYPAEYANRCGDAQGNGGVEADQEEQISRRR